jgi:PilZ domain
MRLRRPFASDRRRRRRQLLNTSVAVFTDSTRIEALGINISDVGMCLFTVADLPIDSEVQVELLPPGGTERVRLWGVIRHRALYLYGVEFRFDIDLDTADRASSQAALDAVRSR